MISLPGSAAVGPPWQHVAVYPGLVWLGNCCREDHWTARLASCVGIWGAAGLPAQSHIIWIACRWLAPFLQSAAAADGLAVGPDMTVTDLGYADDFCLVSATADGLQRIIDVVALWCDAVGMLASSDKTVVVEMTGQQSADGSWSCGGQALRQVSEVRYLGAIFLSGQGFLPSLARLQHRAQAAWAQL